MSFSCSGFWGLSRVFHLFIADYYGIAIGLACCCGGLVVGWVGHLLGVWGFLIGMRLWLVMFYFRVLVCVLVL